MGYDPYYIDHLIQAALKLILSYGLKAFNPYPWIFGTVTERVFWKKIQIHHWWRHSWDFDNENYMCRYSVS